MTTDVQQIISEIDPDLLLADGFDEAIVGIAQRAGSSDVVAYNYEKCIDILIVQHNMEYDEAVSYFEFNCLNANAGPRTPTFIYSIERFT